MEEKSEKLENFACNICKELFATEKLVCKRCANQDKRQKQVLPYEYNLISCKYQPHGCLQTRSFATIKMHQADCEFKQYACILSSGRCDWKGPKNKLLEHCNGKHTEQVLNNPATFKCSINRMSVRDFLIAEFNMLFLVRLKVCLKTQKIYYCVRLLADSAHIKSYNFSLNMFNEHNNVIMKRSVAPHECLSQDEDDSIAISINSLMEIFGDNEGITFELTMNTNIEERTEEFDDPDFEELHCDTCAKIITFDLAYSTGLFSWSCYKCVYNKVVCVYKNKGCAYTGTHMKSRIHSLYYCNYRDQCHICASTFSGSLAEHYQSAHSDITHTTGEIFTEKVVRDAEKELIITSDVGRLHCKYGLIPSKHSSDYKFYFTVCSPMLAGELHFFECTLSLHNTVTGHIKYVCVTVAENMKYFFVDPTSSYDWKFRENETWITDYLDDKLNIKLTITKSK